MGVVFILVFALFVKIGDCQSDCRPRKCSPHGPEIRFPFRLKGMPQCCGYGSAFELACKGNGTMLLTPSAVEFFVEYISYKYQLLYISGPKICVAALHLNLNTTAFPFQYYDFTGFTSSWTFLNCSEDPISFRNSPYTIRKANCLRGYGSNVFLAPSYFPLVEMPETCDTIKTVETPFSPYGFYPYLSLYWDEPECGGCEMEGGKCGFKSDESRQLGCANKTKTFPPYFYAGVGHSQRAAGQLKKKEIIIGVSIGFSVLIGATAIAIRVYHSRKLNRKKEKENNLNVEKFLQDYKSLKPTRYTYVDIKRMTNQFKSKLGQGGFGIVFKGMLPNGISVAVKVLKKSIGDGNEFINEVGTIGMIHHTNVIRLLGFCADGFHRALIYEFMPNESLEKFIFSVDAKGPSLGWENLQTIAIGIARGIEYLHQGCNQRILHFDIKPHNILLDHNFNPKISDFGLAKLCSKEQSNVSITATRGTMGYIAPEVVSRNFGNVSYKSDVYSFGMLLLEMVGGRKNRDATVENTSQAFFPEWIYNRLDQGEELGLRISDEGDAKIAKKLSVIALWCIQWYPVDRPSMKSVILMLEGNQESLMMPPNPFASMALPKTDAVFPENTHVITKLTVISEQCEAKELMIGDTEELEIKT